MLNGRRRPSKRLKDEPMHKACAHMPQPRQIDAQVTIPMSPGLEDAKHGPVARDAPAT